MGGDKDQCKIVPELTPGADVVRDKKECGNSLALDAYSSLLGKTVKIAGERNSGPNGGSGFFVGDGDEIVTAAHIVKNTRSLKVQMPTGEFLDARIIKYDDINDLAVLKIDGLDKDKSRVAPMDGSRRDLTGEPVFSLGAPGVANLEKVLSIGTVQGRTRMENVLSQFDADGYAGLKQAFDTNNFDLQNDATNYVLADRIVTNQKVLAGQSGSLSVDSQGRVVGVLTDSAGKMALATPAEKVIELLNSPGKFDFKYTKQSNVDINPIGTLGVDALIGASALPYVNRVAPALYGAKRLIDLPGDLTKYGSASSGDYKTEHGRLAIEDVGFGAGGLALSIGVLKGLPKVKYVGMAAFGLSLLSSTAGDFDKKHLKYEGMSRKDGGKRPPLMWNWNADGSAVD
mgnify:CR=1 FL=1